MAAPDCDLRHILECFTANPDTEKVTHAVCSGILVLSEYFGTVILAEICGTN